MYLFQCSIYPAVLAALIQSRACQIEDHPLVSFLPLDLTNPDSLEVVISHIDYTMQYGEDEEPKEVSDLRDSLQGQLLLISHSQPRDLDEGDFAGME